MVRLVLALGAVFAIRIFIAKNAVAALFLTDGVALVMWLVSIWMMPFRRRARGQRR